MPSINIKQNVHIESTEKLLLWLLSNIETFENELFDKNFFVEAPLFLYGKLMLKMDVISRKFL